MKISRGKWRRVLPHVSPHRLHPRPLPGLPSYMSCPIILLGIINSSRILFRMNSSF
jgi:hypothetical protein